MDPVKAMEWLEDNMIPAFPLGEVKNNIGAGALRTAARLPGDNQAADAKEGAA
jgi:hypothetical protein